MGMMIISHLITLLLLSFVISNRTEPYEKQLIDHLFKDYNLMVRPVEDPNEPLNISLALFVDSIKDVNEKEGTITMSGWIEIKWFDYNLCWNSTEFGNATYLLHRAEHVWLPDVAFNSAVGNRAFHIKAAFVALRDNCMVEYAPGGVSAHSCDFDVKLFPFDTQTCQFVAATWFSPAKYIQLDPGRLFYNTSISNELWEIVGNKSEVTWMEDGSTPMRVVYTLTIRRKPLYYIVYVIVPLLMLAFLNIMVFRMPPDSGAKVSLSITILLAFAIWLTMLNDLLPISSDSIPILGYFITVLMLLSAASTAVSVHIVRIYNYNCSRPMPSWARYLARIHIRNTSPEKANPEVEQDNNITEHDSTLSWQSVALELDQFAFIVMSLLTVLLIFGCIASYAILMKKDAD